MSQVGLYVQLKFVDWKVWKNKVLKDHDYEMTIASWTFDDASNITSHFIVVIIKLGVITL